MQAQLPRLSCHRPHRLLQTPLHAWHQAHGGRLVEFGGWSMPVQYTTIVEEHLAVRQRVGLFDISHMGRLTFDGPGVLDWLERVTTNQVARLADDQIQYSLMANDHGGVIDDILVYRQPFAYPGGLQRLESREASSSSWSVIASDAAGQFRDRTLDTAMIAVQGPKALETLQPLFDQPLGTGPVLSPHHGPAPGRVDAVVSRTGYTGEDGFEVIVAAGSAVDVWNALLESGKPHGIVPCGLGARDTLRFEAGDAAIWPRAVRDDRPVLGRRRLGRQAGQGGFRRARGPDRQEGRPRAPRIGLILEGRADRPARRRPCWRATARPAGDLGHVLSDAAGQPGDGPGRSADRHDRNPLRWTSGAIASPPASSNCPSTSASTRRHRLTDRTTRLSSVHSTLMRDSLKELTPWIPRHLRFTPTHEWVHLEGDVATVGISKFAVDQLTDLT